eukprot:scaffold146_cov265-Pinguiococcus_pyrenoidosus.AAC.18
MMLPKAFVVAWLWGAAAALRGAPPVLRTRRAALSAQVDSDGDESLKEMKDRKRREKLEKAVELEKEAVKSVLQVRRSPSSLCFGSGALHREPLVGKSGGGQSRSSHQIDAYEAAGAAGLDPWGRLAKSRRVNAERHVLVMLADVYGWRSAAMRSAADRLARECGAITLVPDLFRGESWPGGQPPGGDVYEAWRRGHPGDRVAADIEDTVRAAVEAYKADSVGLVGFCYGGGRVLEALAAAGQTSVAPLENEEWETILDDQEDADLWEELAEDGSADVRAEDAQAGKQGEERVGWAGGAPISAGVVFYPTRYDPAVLEQVACPLCAIFGEKDTVPGATQQDVQALRSKLSGQRMRSPAVHIHVAEGEEHGFAHRQLKRDGVELFNAAAEGIATSPGEAKQGRQWMPGRDYPVDMAEKLERDAPDGSQEVLPRPTRLPGRRMTYKDGWGAFGAKRPEHGDEGVKAFGKEYIASDREAAESAFTIATAWLDTYMRVHLPTVGASGSGSGTSQDA